MPSKLFEDLRNALKIDREKQNVKLTEAPNIKKTEQGHYAVPSKFAVVQCDLIYLQEDEHGYKYILDVVDVASRKMDAIPLRGREAEDVIEGFEQVWKHKYVKKDEIVTLVTDSGSEFKNKKFHDYIERIGIKIRHTMTARKNQTAIVEYYNFVLMKHLGVKTTSNDLADAYENWSELLPKMVQVLNKKEHEKVPKIKDFFGEPKIKENEDILQEGTVVHVRLQQPIDHTVDDKKKRLHGGFRSGDLRWEKGTTTIERVVAYPNQPIRYMVKKYNNVTFLRKELLLADEHGIKKQRESDDIIDKKRKAEIEEKTNSTQPMSPQEHKPKG